MVPGLALASAPALAALLAGGGAFGPADPFLRSLHLGSIREFQGLGAHLGGVGPLGIVQSVSLLPLAVAGGVLLWWRRDGAGVPAGAVRLCVAGVPAAGLLALSLWQVRWLPTASALLLGVLMTLSAPGAPGRARTGWRRALPGALLAAALLPFPVASALFPWRLGYPSAAEAPQVVARDLAHRLRERAGPSGEVVVAAPPTTTTWLVWFGGFRGLGTLYWENAEGLEITAALASAEGEAEARALLDRQGVTHLVVPSWEPFPGPARPATDGAASALGAGFLGRALGPGPLPDWLLPVPYETPSGPSFGPYRITVLEVGR